MPRRATPIEPPPSADGDPPTAVRRAPFSDNPSVGVRGQRSRQRILDAALQVFGDEGYRVGGIKRITESAGCSRAAFYQYFASKEDVFRHLAGQVARQLMVSSEAVPPITTGVDGWQAVHGWVRRHGEIYDRYEPVFRAFQAAVRVDEAVATGADRTSDRNIALLRAKLVTTAVPDRDLDATLAMITEAMSRAHHVADLLATAMPPGTYPRARVDTALTDIVHRTLTGLDLEVNAHPPPGGAPPRARLRPQLIDALQRDDDGIATDLTPVGEQTVNALLDAGHDVLLRRGYHGTRVDDIVAAAGVSHGAFYRYFENQQAMIRVLALRAMRKVATAFAGIPDVTAADGAGSAALRQWLRRYNTVHASETAMIRVWVEAGDHDPRLREESAATLDWGRRRMARVLRPRGFGDVDAEALVMVALIDAFGARRRAPSTVDAVAHIIERGLLGAA